MAAFSALCGGCLFGLGLILAGMADPAKVLAFLDLAGAWDPSLALVMVGAIAVASHGFALAKRRSRTFFGEAMHLPSRRDIDARLLVGSALFGVGWGVAGFCPGPAVVGLGWAYAPAMIFTATMLIGMRVYELADRLGSGRIEADDA